MDEWTFTVIWRICVCLIGLALYTYVAYQFGKSKAEIFDLDGVEPEEIEEAYNNGYEDGYREGKKAGYACLFGLEDYDAET